MNSHILQEMEYLWYLHLNSIKIKQIDIIFLEFSKINIWSQIHAYQKIP